jgi:hypothetical protein
MSRFSANASLVAVLIVLPGASAQAAPEGAPDQEMVESQNPCLAVAGAKLAQWGQERMMIDETDSFPDGTSKNIEAIFTADQAYARRTGSPWIAMDTSRRQRAALPAPLLAKRMGLTGCQLVGSEGEGNDRASHYTFEYLPDMNAAHATGEIWISDSSRLPLRQELHQDEPVPNARVPLTISARFSYGEGVLVPKAATREEVYHRALIQQFWFSQTDINVDRPPPSAGGGLGAPRHQ